MDASQQRLPVSRRQGIKPGACACLSVQSEEPSCIQWCAALRLAEASSALFHQHKPLHCQLQRFCFPWKQETYSKSTETSISWYVPSLATNKLKVYLFLLSFQHKSKNETFHLITIFISTEKDV